MLLLDASKSWAEYIPPWITAAAAFGTVLVAGLIARNQCRLQKALADR
jgi:hypothetical protein